jgi:hypothetical protein
MARIIWVLGSVLAIGAPASAQRFDDTVSIRVEAFFAGIDSFLQVGNASGSIGTGIDFEDELGMDGSQSLPALEVGWRINDDWVLQGQYYTVRRRTEAVIDREIVVDDTVFPVNARVGAGFDSDVYRFTINNLVFQRDRLELGLGVGLHATDFRVFVEGEGRVGDNPARFTREGRSIFAPLPTIGAIGQWEPARRFTLFGRVDWLSLTIGDYRGRLINAEASASYSFHRNADIGVSYRAVDYELNVRKPDWRGDVRYRFTGPSIFVRAGF